jgi:uncharacterized membrane protein
MQDTDPPPNPALGTRPWKFGIREVVLAAIFSALVIVLQVSGLGSIPVPNLSGAMTTLLIPVILGAVIGGPIVGMFAGLVMGIMYLILPATAAFGPITLIVPRLLMALVAWAVYRTLAGRSTHLASVVAGILGSLTNTICAVGLAVLLGQVPASIAVVVLPQALIEMIGCAVIIPILAGAVNTAMKARGQA